jgi:hypothetical protein
LPSWLQTEMNTATTSAADTDEFRNIWIEKFDKQAQLRRGLPKHNAWEGFDAYREFEKAHNLWLVLPNPETGDWPFSHLTDRLSREVHFYKLYETSVVADNQCFRIAIDAVAAAEAKLKKARIPESKVKTEIDKQLHHCTSTVEEVRHSLEQRRNSYWKDVLFAEPEERMRWSVYFDDEKRIHSIPPKELAERERIFDKVKYPRNLVRQIDLDARFQVRVAVILRFYLHRDFRISLRTISRLTVLTYICGNLRKEGDDKLFLKAKVKRGEITVGSVDQKLRAAGME